MKKYIFFILVFALIFSACNSASSGTETNSFKQNTESSKDSSVQKKPVVHPADAATILARKQVPILCYHHIRDTKASDGPMTKTYSVSPAHFAEQIKALKDSGYESVLPADVYDYLLFGKKLPAKPVMLSFDDTDEEKFSVAYPILKKYGFKGVFFIMTVSINRPRYMTTEQLKTLSDEGNAVEAHTWDHHMVTKYQGEDWQKQLVEPKKKVEEITGKSADYFAYPFGLWNRTAFPELKKAGYKMAFSLSTKRDSTQPLYTVRRMIVAGQWSTPGVLKSMRQTFDLDK